ncbi:hypothetical protein [Trueperella sp. LYQ143]|uniref:hypothetical protein n=1 Tax=Trueperella sp. LYQ143 TaxID=3391059 RepID=UPI003983279A
MSSTTLNARAPLPSLLRSLSRAGWGELTSEIPAVRLVLRGLSDLVNDYSGRALVTATQVADVTALSERWTRHALNRLEELGLIRWVRGGIIHGKPTPSFIEVSKRALIDLIRKARATIEELRAMRKVRTAQRLSKISPHSVIWGRYSRRSDHAELTNSLLSPTEDTSRSALRRNEILNMQTRQRLTDKRETEHRQRLNTDKDYRAQCQVAARTAISRVLTSLKESA